MSPCRRAAPRRRRKVRRPFLPNGAAHPRPIRPTSCVLQPHVHARDRPASPPRQVGAGGAPGRGHAVYGGRSRPATRARSSSALTDEGAHWPPPRGGARPSRVSSVPTWARVMAAASCHQRCRDLGRARARGSVPCGTGRRSAAMSSNSGSANASPTSQFDRADQPVHGEARIAGRQRRVDRLRYIRPWLGRAQFAHQRQPPVQIR